MAKRFVSLSKLKIALMGAVGGGMRGRRGEVELFLRCWGFVWSLEPPWVAKHGGRPAYDAKGLVLCAL